MIFGFNILCEAYYALGKDRFIVFMTSAIHIVADLETPTRQCTKVAVPSNFPASNTMKLVFVRPHDYMREVDQRQTYQ